MVGFFVVVVFSLDVAQDAVGFLGSEGKTHYGGDERLQDLIISQPEDIFGTDKRRKKIVQKEICLDKHWIRK